MTSNYLLRAVLVAAIFFFIPAITQAAGHIVPTGETIEEASQLIVWYDEGIEAPGSGTRIQVTNGSADTSVNIHVQIFADEIDGEPPLDLCREHDFTDTLTPNDTVSYELGYLDSVMNPPEGMIGGDNNHNPIPINISGTQGFVVITPVDSVTLPRQAISHNHLSAIFVNSIILGGTQATNAMGRKAVDFATGEPLADGTLLDGVNTGFELLQPSTISLNFGGGFVTLHSIAFTDNYADANGEYRAEPSTVTWDTLIYDEDENATSCNQLQNTCYATGSLNGFIMIAGLQNRAFFGTVCPNANVFAGWAEMAVSGLEGLENHVTFVSSNNFLNGMAMMQNEQISRENGWYVIIGSSSGTNTAAD